MTTDERLDQILTRLTAIETRLDAIDTRLSRLPTQAWLDEEPDADEVMGPLDWWQASS